MQAWPYWPRPPDWRMNLPSPSARLGDGFAIGDLRRAGVGFHLEFAEQTVADDFQVQFAHARDDELAGFLVGEAAERRVFFGQALQAFAHLLAIRLGLRLDGHADDRLGERRRLERDVEILIAQRVAGGDVPQADQRGDVAGKNVVRRPCACLPESSSRG